MLIENGHTRSWEVSKRWAETMLELAAKTPPIEVPLKEIQEKLKSQIRGLKDLFLELEQAGPLPNPRLALETRAKMYVKAHGTVLVRERRQVHRQLLSDVTKRLTRYYFQWRRSQCPAFSAFFDPESFSYLHHLFQGDERMLAMLNEQKT